MTKQLSLFPEEQVQVTQSVADLLAQGAALAISLSGGKDSQAMLNWLMQLRQQYRWTGHCFAILHLA